MGRRLKEYLTLVEEDFNGGMEFITSLGHEADDYIW